MRTPYSLLCGAAVVAFALAPGMTSAQSRANATNGRVPGHPNVHASQVRGGGAPANDDCGAAEVLTVGADCASPTAGDNSAATQSTEGPACDNATTGIFADVWYSFNSGTNTVVNVELVPSATMTDNVLVVLDGCTGTELLCYVLPPGPQPVTVTENTDYVIRVYSNTQYGDPGTFTICVSGAPPPPPTPANDDCDAAEALIVGTDCSSPTPGDNTSATQSTEGPTCDNATTGIFADVWYSFNSGTNTSVDVTLAPSAAMTDNVLVVLDGCTGTELLCYVLPPGPQTVTVTENTDYIIRVYSNTQYGTPGEFTICVSGTPPPPPPPANNDCDGAIVLETGASCVSISGTTLGSTESQPADSCNSYLGNANDDVWYTFTATSTEMTVAVLGGADFDAVVELFEGACGSLVPIGCADATVSGEAEEIQQSGLVVGQVYTVRLFSYSGVDPVDPTFTICVVDGLGTNIGIGENTATDLFNLFPNPTTGDVSITWSGRSGNVLVEVFDMTGRVVYNAMQRMTAGQPTQQSVKGLASGTYTVRLTGNEQSDEHRLVVN